MLTLGVGEFDMRRLLVDPGSSVDLLQMSAYKKMSYSLSALENLRCLLSRFNGATMTSLSGVVLPVQVGPVTLNIQFPMVDDLSPYIIPLWDVHGFAKWKSFPLRTIKWWAISWRRDKSISLAVSWSHDNAIMPLTWHVQNHQIQESNSNYWPWQRKIHL